ncbi:MAG: translational GTPase TypA [Phycisphaeraceae bacterium]|nr:translational GTPase TypA [Phycisphaeraceae bacterium]
MTAKNLRNVAIIAHVDHGKTTLVDRLLYQSGMFRNEDLDKLAGGQHGLIMDSNDLERERGITIFSKNCEVNYRRSDGEAYKINVIDTPGHADFGGEVERVLKMADGVLLLVDAFDGPMPQTRFVLHKALDNGLRPIVVVNKCDRPDARPEHVVNEVFDLLVELGADDLCLDFPVVYASGREGWATRNLQEPRTDLRDIFEAIIDHVPASKGDPQKPLQMLVTTLDYSEYVGRIAVGRVVAGVIRKAQSVAVIDRHGKTTQQRVLLLQQFEGLGRKEVEQVEAGDIVAVLGLDPVDIGNTIADPENPVALTSIKIDEPTLTMTFRVNNSPFAGKEGTYVTSRQIRQRLERELQSNVALRVDFSRNDEFQVSGRGLLHLGILLENMRREGYELAAGKPQVIYRQEHGQRLEPIELLVVDCPADCQSSVMALLGERRAELVKMDAKSGTSGFSHMEFTIPARGLIGLRSRMLTATQGRAVMHHIFVDYEPARGEVPQRQAGVMVATETGRVTSYALDSLYDRGTFFVEPGQQIYEGQIVGEHCKDNDITVNVARAKQLTNVRNATKEENNRLKAPRQINLEAALEYIEDDELVEITPESIRIRKRNLKEADRRRESRRVASLEGA